jgi:hypothetical protein
MENRISRSPVIRESDMTTNTIPLFPLEGRFPTDHQPRISTLPYTDTETVAPMRLSNPARPVERDYLESPFEIAPQPTSNVVFVTDTTSAQGASETPSSPLDVTMLAMLGLTMAGAGVMKSQSAQKKQQELAQANAVAQAQLATAKADQAQTASANWEHNQAMQASATQKVYTQVQQSQANIDFWASYTAWKIKVAEAEEKRRQAELEARIKAYYAALRLKPASPQPVESMPVFGLLKGLLTGAKILGQGIKTVKSIVKAIAEKNDANKPTGVGSGNGSVVGSGFSGGFGAGAIGGLAISPNWGDFGVSQSQEEDEAACRVQSDNLELLGYIFYGLEATFQPQAKLIQGLFMALGIQLTTESMYLADACGTDFDKANILFNHIVLTSTGALSILFGSQIALGGLGFILFKEALMSIGSINLNFSLRSGKTYEEYLSETNQRSQGDCNVVDYEETAGDLITAHVARYYINHGINSFDDERVGFGWMNENDQPITRIMNSEEFRQEVEDLQYRIGTISDSPLMLQERQVWGFIQYFESQFFNIMSELGYDGLDEYPLLAHATLLQYLTQNDMLDNTILSGIRLQVRNLGEDPYQFMNPIINNSIEFQEGSWCN